MARGHKFAKLKTANHQKLAIRQNLAPPNLPAIRYFLFEQYCKIPHTSIHTCKNHEIAIIVIP